MSNNSNRARQFFSAMESLEERVLFDGMPDGDLSFLLPGSEQPVPAQVQLNADADADSTGPRELVLIDAAVEDPQTLLQSILESTLTPHSRFGFLTPIGMALLRLPACCQKARSTMKPFTSSHTVIKVKCISDQAY